MALHPPLLQEVLLHTCHMHSMGLLAQRRCKQVLGGMYKQSHRSSNTEATWCAGESFLALVSSSIALGAGLSSFSAKVKQHLTELTITLDHKNRGAQPLEGRCMLTALQTLRLDSGCIDLSGETLHLKLPRLCSLHMSKVKQGELVLTCPSLAEARFDNTKSLRIKVEEAALTSLVLFGCMEAQFALRSAVDQLENLETLRIELGSEVGRDLIEDIGQMRRLQELVYDDIPIARIPRRFPQRLQTMSLYSFDWFQDVAKSRVALAARLVHDCKSWDDRTARRLPELLPIDSLDYVQLAALEGILTCTTARGMEAKGILLTDTSEESYVIGVHGPLRSCGKGKLFELHVPRRGTDHGGNHMV